MSDTEPTPASYNEAAPGEYSTEEHLRAQQQQTSASNGEPLHPELSDESDLTDPAEVGSTPPTPIDTGKDADEQGAHASGDE